MFKRFFSLLLVLTMAIGFAAPAFAADQPMTIGRNDFRNFAKSEPSSTEKTAATNFLTAYDKAVEFAGLNGNDEYYTPGSWKILTDNIAVGKELIDNYDSGDTTIDVSKLNTTRAALTSSISLPAAGGTLDKTATEDDIADLKKAIADAEALYDTLTTAAKGTLKGQIDGIKQAITDHENGTTIINRKQYQQEKGVNGTGGYIDQIKGFVETAKEYTNTKTVKITSAAFDASDKAKVNITINAGDKTKDDYSYVVKAQLNDKPAIYLVGSASAVVEAGNAALSSKTSFTIADLWPKVNGEADPKAPSTFVKNDKVTITVYTCVAKSDRFDEGYDETVAGEPTVIVFDADPEDPAAKSSGFIAAREEGVTYPIETVTDTFYLILNQDIQSIRDNDTTMASATLTWKLTGPGGFEAPKTVSANTEDRATWDVAAVATAMPKPTTTPNPNAIDKNVTAIPAGDYKLALVSGAAASTPKDVVAATVSVAALDKSPVSAYLKELGLDDEATVLANWGPYATVTDAVKTIRLVNTYISTPVAATKAQIDFMGVTEADDKAGKGEYTGSVYEIIDDAVADIYDLSELKAAVDHALTLDPDDYSNWKTGLMAGALEDAYRVLLAASNPTSKYADIKVDVNGDGKIDSKDNIDTYTLTTYGIEDADDIKALVDELKLAEEKLDSLFASTDALQALIDAAPADGAKYTDASWKALQDAIADAKAVIESKPTAADQQKVDDAVAALQAAIKGLEEKAGAKNGLEVEEGKTYVYKDGEKVSGVQKVDGKLYYASAKDNHVMKGGWINAGGGKKVYAGADGVLLTGYQKIGGKAYYLSVNDGHALKNGKVSAGKGVQYVAGTDGVLATGLTKVPSGEQYYCSVKDNHIMKAPAGKGTAPVTGLNGAKYLVNEKGVVVG